MSPFLELIFSLLVIILFAKIGSFVSIKLGQPSVLGELLVGVLLGPSLLDLTHLPFLLDTHLTEVVIEIGELGVLLLMFIAGLELHLSELAKNSKVSAYAGILGVIFPVALGWGTGALFGFDTPSALFLGLILGATSVSISAQTLMELKVLRTRVGLGLLGAAVFDDILVILLLSTVIAIFNNGGGLLSILFIFLRILLYLAASVAFGFWGLPWLTRRIGKMEISQPALSLALVILFLYGLTAEVVGGMAAISGAFLAGLMFARTPEKERIERGMRSLAYSFFVPVFFVSIGLGINLREFNSEALLLLLVIVIIAVLGKIFGSGLGALLGGFSRKESLQLGAGMVSRGEVGLIVAAIGVQEGFVQPAEFSAVIGMVIITTLITPPLLRSLFPKKKPATASERNPIHIHHRRSPMFMIMLILNNPDKYQAVLTAWETAGAPGVTILPSTGLGRIHAKMGLADDLPLLPSLEDFMQEEESLHRTLISIVRERAVVDGIIQATLSVLGDLNRPNTGILIVLPVLEAYGLDRYKE